LGQTFPESLVASTFEITPPEHFLMSKVHFGIDVLLTEPGKVSGRIGLVTNNAARLAGDSTQTSRVALLAAGANLVRLFSPEHGLNVAAADGVAVADGRDALTQLPIVSLYGDTMRPPRASLMDLDAVVFDIPDIGTRFYTYIWTLLHTLEACAELGLPLVVLDRPNPLGGDLAAAEGPMLDAATLGGFLGRANIPIRHSLTVGELAQLWNAEKNLNAKLGVVPCSGWKRAQHWPATGLPFVPTSPAIISYASALAYPGICLFEGSNLSVGRGTEFPFQAIGAPWLKAPEVVARLQALNLPGVGFLPQTVTPTQSPWAGQACAVVRLEVTHPEIFRPVRTGLELLAVVRAIHPGQFQWANYPTAANPSGAGHFEQLVGQSGLRELLETSPPDLHERLRACTATPDWSGRGQARLLYA
jgi:uncharacterized protein YbbC (DUF1343 family)